VVAIDSSSKSLETSMGLAQREAIQNVEFYCVPLEGYVSGAGFDAAICSGVLHHVVDPVPFVRKLRHLCKPLARVCVMVYGDQVRGFLPDFCEALRMMGAKPDADGVAFTRWLLNELPEHHPAKALFDVTDKSDAQIADLFLHPYFKHYRADEFVLLMSGSFNFIRWMNPRPIAALVALAERLDGLDRLKRWRIGQVLNQFDAKLTAMFEAA